MCLTLERKFLRLIVLGGTSRSKRVYAMNITMQNSEMLIGKIVLLISYFITIPLIGCCRAWVAEKMGDDTPEQFGFLTCNLTAHVSWLWVALMIFVPSFDFGFGKYIPINPLNIQGKNRGLRLMAAYLADTCASIILATLALFALVLFFGQAEFFKSYAVLRGVVSYANYDSTSSHGIAIALLLTGFIVFNSMLAAFNSIVNLFYLGFFYYFDGNMQLAEHVEWVMLVGPLLLIILFFGIVQFGVLQLIVSLGSFFALLMGIK